MPLHRGNNVVADFHGIDVVNAHLLRQCKIQLVLERGTDDPAVDAQSSPVGSGA